MPWVFTASRWMVAYWSVDSGFTRDSLNLDTPDSDPRSVEFAACRITVAGSSKLSRYDSFTRCF